MTATVPQHHITYATKLLRDGFFDGWFVKHTVHNVLESVYTDDWHKGGLYVGGRAKFEQDAAAYAATTDGN